MQNCEKENYIYVYIGNSTYVKNKQLKIKLKYKKYLLCINLIKNKVIIKTYNQHHVKHMNYVLIAQLSGVPVKIIGGMTSNQYGNECLDLLIIID